MGGLIEIVEWRPLLQQWFETKTEMQLGQKKTHLQRLQFVDTTLLVLRLGEISPIFP